MSVQLSLLPQNFDGNYTSFTVQPNNLLNDAIQWNGIDAAVTTQYVMGSVAGALAFAARNALDHFSSSTPVTVNQWYVYGETSTTVNWEYGIPTPFLNILLLASNSFQAPLLTPHHTAFACA